MRAAALLLAALASTAHAADPAAGAAKAGAVCAACHGANGVSVSEGIPNLAAQRAGYLEAQLKFFKDGTRKEPGNTSRAAIMNAIAARLSAEDIADLAAYFAAQPGAAAAAKSELLPNLAKTGVAFPQDYKTAFTRYATIFFPDRNQLRYYYANASAVRAAKAGRPLPDGAMLFVEVYSTRPDVDGWPLADRLTGYAAMARDKGWGGDIPELLRNENWNYALFTPEKRHRPGVNQAECLACHKPQGDVSYTFTLERLADAAKGG
ncbi:MAG TPA: cytochrome P460 family protein [Burkholderiales bacterium]